MDDIRQNDSIVIMLLVYITEHNFDNDFTCSTADSYNCVVAIESWHFLAVGDDFKAIS